MTNLREHLDGVVLERPMECLGLRLEPEENGAAVLPAGEGMERKRYRRQLSVLKGYLAVAAAEQGVSPLVIRAGTLPEQEGPEALGAYWYGEAVKAETLRSRLFASYNALGVLPGGFSAVREHAIRWLGEPLAEKLLKYVKDARWEESDLGTGEEAPVLDTWEPWELEALSSGILTALRQAF